MLAPEPISDSLWNRTVDRLSRGVPGGSAEVERLLNRPDVLPRVMGLGVDNDGALWLLRTHTSERPQHWLRLNAAGELRDTLMLVDGYIAHLRGDTLWRNRSDADGMQSVERCVAVSR